MGDIVFLKYISLFVIGRLKGGEVGGIFFLKSVSLFVIGRLSRGGG